MADISIKRELLIWRTSSKLVFSKVSGKIIIYKVLVAKLIVMETSISENILKARKITKAYIFLPTVIVMKENGLMISFMEKECTSTILLKNIVIVNGFMELHISIIR